MILSVYLLDQFQVNFRLLSCLFSWVFAAVEKVFRWNNPAWSDANSADSDGFGAIEQPLEMIKSIGRSHTQTQTQNAAGVTLHRLNDESPIAGTPCISKLFFDRFLLSFPK